MIARSATYADLLTDIRVHFFIVSSVQNLVVLYQPADGNGTLLNNWVEIHPSAYGAVHNGAELFINVVHPLTKEYILPMPGQLRSNHLPGKQIRQTDGLGNPLFAAQGTDDQQVSTNKPKDSSHRHKHSTLSLELERPGGDAFASGWGAASGRFRRSAKLVPNVKDCKEAIGQTVGESNFYPDDEEEQEQPADKIPRLYQDPPPSTDAGWYAGAEPDAGGDDAFNTEAQVLTGGAGGGHNAGKKTKQIHSKCAHDMWHAVSPPPPNPFGPLPRGHQGHRTPTGSQWGHHGRIGDAKGWDRNSSPEGLFLDHGERTDLKSHGHCVPYYVRNHSRSPSHAEAKPWEGNTGGWTSQHIGIRRTDQEYSRIAAGPAAGPNAAATTPQPQTNGIITNGATTNGATTNGNTTNGYYIHHEVSPNHHHLDQNNGASDWSPPRPEYNGYNRPQNPRMGLYPPAQPNFKSFPGSRLCRDPAEVTFGSPKARVHGSTTGWTTIGREKKTWANKPLQVADDYEESQGFADDSHTGNEETSWYDPPPPNGFASAIGPEDNDGAFKHSSRRAVKDGTNKYWQISSKH